MDTDAWPVPDPDQGVDWDRLEPGDQVVVRRGPVVVCRGIVDQVGPGLGLVWVQDPGTGMRKMFCEDDVAVHPDPVDSALTRSLGSEQWPGRTGLRE